MAALPGLLRNNPKEKVKECKIVNHFCEMVDNPERACYTLDSLRDCAKRSIRYHTKEYKKMAETTVKTVNKSKWSTLDMAYIAVFAVLIAICSWISIPTVVPFTLQTFAVFAAVGILGGRRGTLAVLVYILLGAIGIPVFAGFSGGVGVLFGTTGGYILGFLLTGLLYWGLTKALGEKLPIMILSMVLGLVVCYAFGTAWFMVVYAKMSGAIGIGTALSWCVIPFIIPDLCKIALAVALTKVLKPHVK